MHSIDKNGQDLCKLKLKAAILIRWVHECLLSSYLSTPPHPARLLPPIHIFP
jgi:hypothetical protein